MKSYQEFVEDAIQNYKTLPAEPNDIYKKYTLHIPFDETEKEVEVDISKHEADMERFSKALTDKTRIKFDAIISSHSVKNFNKGIEITQSSKVDFKKLENKMFKSKDDKFAAFSNAASKQFVFIDVEEGQKKRVNLLFVNSRNLPVQIIINAKKNSTLELFELFTSDGNSNAVVTALHEINEENGANVEVNVLHNENETTHIANLFKAVAKDDAKLRANFIYSGGAGTKSRGVIDSAGANSEVDITEFAFGVKNQKFDLGTYIENTKPRSIARLESGAVLTGSSYCMLKGFAKVHKGAKGCLSKITERAILLSKDAHIDALPDMAIDYSNEVKATHSASTSPMDKEALFYLESRGIGEKSAEKIFITSFISKYISKIKDGLASEVAMSVMLDKLEKGSLGNIPEITTSGIWMAR